MVKKGFARSVLIIRIYCTLGPSPCYLECRGNKTRIGGWEAGCILVVMVVITAGSSEDHRKREGREGGRRGKRAGRMAEVEGLLASTDYNAARQRRQRRRQRSRYTLMLYSLSSLPRGAASCGALGLTCSRTPSRTCRTCGMNATRVYTKVGCTHVCKVKQFRLDLEQQRERRSRTCDRTCALAHIWKLALPLSFITYLKGWIPRCLYVCSLRDEECAKVLPHPGSSHLYGFSPRCDRWCTWRLEGCAKPFPQN